MIVRGPRDKNYTVLKNTCVSDPGLSARAKGIHTYLMSLPGDWTLYKKELFTHFAEGTHALDKAFKELEKNGYIHKEPKRVESGQLRGWKYTIYEEPTVYPKTAHTENRDSVNRPLGNQDVLSTKGIIPEKDQGLIQGKIEIETEKENHIDIDSLLEKVESNQVALQVYHRLLQYQGRFPDEFRIMDDPLFSAVCLVNEQIHLHEIRGKYTSTADVVEQVRSWFDKRYSDPENMSYALADVQYIKLCVGLGITPSRSAEEFAGKQAFHGNLKHLFFDLRGSGASVENYKDWLVKRRRLSIRDALSRSQRQSFCAEFGTAV